MTIVADGRYRVGRRIGGGTFGEVFAGEDVESLEVVAVKAGPVGSLSPQLTNEAKLLPPLQRR